MLWVLAFVVAPAALIGVFFAVAWEKKVDGDRYLTDRFGAAPLTVEMVRAAIDELKARPHLLRASETTDQERALLTEDRHAA